jgi:hypothetical protein
MRPQACGGIRFAIPPYGLAVSGTDRAKGLVQLKTFAEQNRTHPLAADAQRAISQIEK